MNFSLNKPCKNCPFRRDLASNFSWLGKERAEEIAESLKRYVFPCHKTVKHDDDGDRIQSNEVACYGALVLMKKEDVLEGHGLIRFARMFGMMDSDYNIEENLPIVESFVEFAQMHGELTRTTFIKRSLLNQTVNERNDLINTFHIGGEMARPRSKEIDNFNPSEQKLKEIFALRTAYTTGLKTDETKQACRDYMRIRRNKKLKDAVL